MAITADDIKLFESERMADTADGGGRMTVSEIPDGVAGNVFPKVSRIDSVYGRFQLRKIYLAVQTATQDVYAGSHLYLTDPPDNPGVGFTLFATGSHFDVRTDAVNRVESYIVKGPPSRMTLYGNHFSGQSSITVYQRTSEPVPEVASVLCLSIEGDGFTPAEQYVRIAEVVGNEVREFTVEVTSGGETTFLRRLLTLKIDSLLRQDFPGAEFVVSGQDAEAGTVVRTTTVQDAARYFGLSPIEAVSAGALTVTAASVYANLVPTATRETGLSLVSAIGAEHIVAAGPASLTWKSDPTVNDVVFTAGARVTMRLGRAVAPESVTVRVYSSAVVQSTRTDDGAGGFGAMPTAQGVYAESVDYETGDVVLLSVNLSAARRIEIDYTPAAYVVTTAHTAASAITIGTRGTVYNRTLQPLPAPGTVRVSYRALGRWYDLRDDGTGQIAGDDAAYGSGIVDYATGSATVTLGALPDVDSDVVWSWGTPVSHAVRAGGTSDAGTTVRWSAVLPDAPVEPGSVSLVYVRGGNVTATDSAGTITGTGVTGTIVYATGEIELEFSALPDASTSITIDYSQEQDGGGGASAQSGTIAVGAPGSFNLGVTNITPVGVSLTIDILVDGETSPTRVRCGDNGSGGIVSFATAAGNVSIPSQAVGTINYTTGDVSLSTSGLTAERKSWISFAWLEGSTGAGATAGNFDFSVRVGASPTLVPAPQFVSALTANPPWVDITRTIGDEVVAGSLVFRATGREYIDRNGQLYTDLDRETGAALLAGTIDYATGRANLTTWSNGVALALAVDACLTLYGRPPVDDYFHRTQGSPVRPASYTVQVTATDGTLLSGVSDTDGNITGTDITGTIRQTMGSVSLVFARPVQPETLRYSAVVTSSVPLDASILGIENTRLPLDGRVPIFRAGDVAVIHNTLPETLPDPAVASATYVMPRGDLSALRLVDQVGTVVDRAQYTVDLVAGSVTMDAALDLSAYTEPLIAQHRIEERSLISDVQINGDITLSAALLNSYGASGSYVSSALLSGDLFARAENVFDQQTWTNEWSDVLIGSQATGEYDDINFPIEVVNAGAVTERWRIHFTGSTAFQVIGENLGVIATGTTGADITPVNPVTGQPYFTLRASGWGAGWSIGNNLRFNTVGASAPAWLTRTVLSGAALTGDAFDLAAAGDVD
ncbi:MAG: hypothetical protein KDH20_22355 [Rhodocyclaceae bacterium]|nr:hypothetical protein [Rhodocyclaceae bacterium]